MAADQSPSPPAPSPLAPSPLLLRHYDAGGGGGRSNPLFTVLPVSALAIGLVLLVAVAVILVLTNRHRGKPAVDAGSSTNGDNPGAPASGCKYYYAAAAAGSGAYGPIGISVAQARSRRVTQVFTYRELERATEGFSEGKVLGQGTHGVVFRGRLDDGTPAAIKRLRQGEREFRVEVDLLSQMHSPHLVGLLGYCADQNHRLLVFEFMPNGSLKSHLHSSPPSPPLDWQTRLSIALDCARALEFLHEHNSPAVIHRDFNCGNVLLDHHYRGRVAHFGAAKVGSGKADAQVVTRVLGTTGYLAPEYVSTGKLTTKSDVFSYGVVLLELLTGRVPVDTRRPPGQHVLVSWALPRLTDRERVVKMVDPALKGQFAVKDLVQVAAIAAMCVQSKPEYRPLMTDVVQSLIPIVKMSPAISCSSTPARNAAVHHHHHVVYMTPAAP